MRLSTFIQREFTFIIKKSQDKACFISDLVGRVQQKCGDLDGAKLLKRLVEREEEVTTGIGHNVAIPHATIEGLEQTLCIIAQTPHGQDFQALDGSPVHITLLLISPPKNVGVHIRLLARIARLFSDHQFVHRVATAATEEELIAVIQEEDYRHV